MMLWRLKKNLFFEKKKKYVNLRQCSELGQTVHGLEAELSDIARGRRWGEDRGDLCFSPKPKAP